MLLLQISDLFFSSHCCLILSIKLIFCGIPGYISQVDGQLAVARAFGDKSLKRHMSSEPNVAEFVILASDGLWKGCYFFFALK